MSVVPTVVVGAPSATAPTSTTAASSGGELAGVFAALVDALGAQLATVDPDVAAPEGDATDAAGEPDTDTETEADTDLALAGAAAMFVAPRPLQAAARPIDADARSAISGLPPSVGDDGAVVDVDTVAGARAAELMEGAEVPSAAAPTQPSPPAIESEPDLVATLPSGDDADVPVVDDAADAGSADTAPLETEAAPPEAEGVDAETGEPTIEGTEVQGVVAAGSSAGSDAAAASQPVGGPNAVASTSATSATSGTAAPAPTAPPALPEQLLEVLTPLRRSPDGTHQLAVQLRPDELGEVLVDVRVRGNEINLSLRADLPGTVDLLRESLAELRAELEAAGFRSGDLDVGSHAERRPDPGTARVPADGPLGRAGDTGPPSHHDPAPAVHAGVAGLDLRL